MTSLAHQTLVEHQILEHVKDALRLTLEMRTASGSVACKLSSVHFMTDSFERHLDRLLGLEEDGGYMEMVRERRPQLIEEATRLRQEHTELRELLAAIKQALQELTSGDEDRFHGVCHKLRDFLDRLDEHDAREIDLLEQVLIDPGLTGSVKPSPTSAD